MQPQIIRGAISKDDRGSIKHNNAFDLSEVRRMYIIQNRDTEFVRGWKGHEIEKRWFVALNGSFTLRMVKIDNWESPSPEPEQLTFILSSEAPDVLLSPPGYATAIQANEEGAQLLTLSDYLLGATNDEHNYPVDYFKTLSSEPGEGLTNGIFR